MRLPLRWSLGAGELLRGQAVLLEGPHLLEEGLEHLAEVVRFRARIEVQHPGVSVLLGPRVDGVHEPLALPDLLEEPRGHAATHDVVQEIEGVALGRHVGDARETEHELDLLEGLFHEVDAGDEDGRDLGMRHRGLHEALEA